MLKLILIGLSSWLVAPIVSEADGAAVAAKQDAAASVKEIVDLAGVSGGVIVLTECGDGVLLRQLGMKTQFRVFGLSTSTTTVAAVRTALRQNGICGRVQVDEWNGRQLPFIDNFVNVLIVHDCPNLRRDEAWRVLTPKGRLLSRSVATWTAEIKPWPAAMDDWTHWNYSPANNPCSHDLLVGPLERMQWLTRPLWSKYHFSSPGVHFIVSGNGRVFHDADESPSSTIGGGFPEKWALLARDAFNGTVLWRTRW